MQELVAVVIVVREVFLGSKGSSGGRGSTRPVSYTHLTLPTRRTV